MAFGIPLPGVGLIDPANAVTEGVRTFSDFVLRERGGQRRTVRLRREAMPFRSLPIPRSSAQNITRHQGSTDATVQKFGPMWDDIRLRGSWRNVWLSKGLVFVDDATKRTTLTTADEVDRLFDSLWIEGQDLDFVWETQAFRVTISNYTPTWLRKEDLDWELTLAVIGPGLTEAKNEYETEFQFVRDAGTLASRISGYLTKAREFIKGIQAYERAANQALDRVDLLRRELETTVQAAGDLAEAPARLAQRAHASATGLVGAWGTVITTVNGIDAAYASDGSALGLAKAQRARIGVVRESRNGQADALVIVRTTARLTAPKITKIVVATTATDLRILARQEYGSTDLWTTIAKANGLSRPRPLAPGLSIIIPERPA